jgi:hypothetical protein
MGQSMLKGFTVMSLSVGLLSVVLSNSAPAQTPAPKPPPKTTVQKKSPPVVEAPPPIQQWMSVSIVQVKPEMINEWLELNKTVVIPALKKAGVKQRDVWQTAQFGQQFEYIVITPIDDFAQYDGEPPLRKGLGEEGYRAYLEKSRKMVAAVRTYAYLPRADLSHMGKTGWTPKFAVVTSVSVAPGRSQEFESLIRTEVVPAVKKTEISGYFVSQTGFGGDVNQYTTVALYDSFADIGKGSYVERGMGQAAYARFIRKTTGIVVRLERTISRHNSELSFGGQ